MKRFAFLLGVIVLTGASVLPAQENRKPPVPPSNLNNSGPPDDELGLASASPARFIENTLQDQKAIWTSPFKARVPDLNWMLPAIGIAAGLVNADAEISSRISTTNTISSKAGTISNAGLAAALGAGGGLYLWGKLKSNDHQQEAGILTVEAMTNSLVVVEALKMVTQRQRPLDGPRGKFWSSGSPWNSSFPSAHAMLTWSAASVLAHEYPSPLITLLAYGAAGGVSIARVAAKNHFTSDVFVGSAMGWLIGRQVYAAHHDARLPGGGWGTFHKDNAPETPPEDRASPYVPLDSWVYPALDRLVAMGVINTAIRGLKPWTRRECARMVEEASTSIDDSNPDEVSRLYDALAREFAVELGGQETNYAGLDSVYARLTSISGPPLTDSYHFGQTIVNDYGRPYQKGLNSVEGFSASGASGAFGFYVRGEYEHAPSAPGVSQFVQNQIQLADVKPLVVTASPVPAFDQFRLLDTYVSLNLRGWQASFGKQSLWLGPGEDPFLSTNNAEPMYMFRVDQTSPRRLPGFLRILGDYRTEFWVGKLTGQHFVDTQDTPGTVFSLGRTLPNQPMINGFKLNFRVTPNFEFGIGRTGLWGGPDFPITLHTTRLSLFSAGNAVGRGNDPGDRRSTFDFSYRFPGLRKWLTLYEDSFVEDEISPIGYPRRAAHEPGIYISHLPGLSRLDLRAEAAYTNLPGLIQALTGGFFYWNVRYLDGYTNKGQIIGDATVGRQGISYRADSTYWISSDKSVQLGFRANNVDHIFLGGGNFRDAYLNSNWKFKQPLTLTSFIQYERWNFPLLSPGQRKNDVTVSFQLTYEPHWRIRSQD